MQRILVLNQDMDLGACTAPGCYRNWLRKPAQAVDSEGVCEQFFCSNWLPSGPLAANARTPSLSTKTSTLQRLQPGPHQKPCVCTELGCREEHEVEGNWPCLREATLHGNSVKIHTVLLPNNSDLKQVLVLKILKNLVMKVQLTIRHLDKNDKSHVQFNYTSGIPNC